MAERLTPVHYELRLSKGDEHTWRVTRVEIEEALSRPHRAQVEAYALSDTPELQDLLGCSAALLLGRGLGQDRAVCGLVARLDVLSFADEELHLRFHIVPAFALLRQRIDSRIWQDHSVREIVTQVLDQALAGSERSFEFDGIRRGVAARDYCVQYRESDFAFVSRLLEAEGISYEFTHDAEQLRETLVVRDANEQYAKLENIDGSNEIPIIVSSPSEAEVESIQALEWSTQLTSTGVLRRDFDWTTPRLLASAETSESESESESWARRIFDHGRRRFITDDLRERAEDLHHAVALEGQVLRGRSNVSAMRPGLRFVLRGHHHELEVEYLITEVVHRGAESDVDAAEPGSKAEPGAEPYTNQFCCVPFTATLRPERRTPCPREYGPQTAIVTGPASEEIHTDEHGRIKVQFYWQEQASYTERSSCWIRCSQSWAGAGWGAQFIPRIGMEVVVEFLEGNPDRPLVTGCVYNAENRPPFSLPEHKTQSGWRSDSAPGGCGANELRFEDAAGNEEIFLHAEHDWTIEVEHDKRQRVDHDERLEVVHERVKIVGASERYQIGTDQTGEVAASRSLSVGRDHDTSVGQDRSEQVGRDASTRIGRNMSVEIASELRESIGADMQTSVAGEQSLDVGKDARERISGDKLVDASNIALETSEDLSLTSGQKFLVEASDRLTLHGEDEVLVEAAKKMTFKCGDASIVLDQSGKVTIKGSDIKIKGSGSVSIKGQKVAEN